MSVFSLMEKLPNDEALIKDFQELVEEKFLGFSDKDKTAAYKKLYPQMNARIAALRIERFNKKYG